LSTAIQDKLFTKAARVAQHSLSIYSLYDACYGRC